MLSAHGDITVVAADFRLCTLDNGVASGIDAQVHRRFATAIADGFHLDQRVCQAQQCGRPCKQFALEVRTQAVTKDRNARIVRQPGKLPNLILGQELRFVHQYTCDRAFRMIGKNARLDIGVDLEPVGIAR